MCGICGFIYNKKERPADQNVLKEMCQTITHRGPDDQGEIVLDQCGLGMRRLSIIDLNTGHQPISTANQEYTIVFNGEIYNFQEIRKILENKGHVFETLTDTEVILKGYAEWGVDICEKLNGMFSFAIWDRLKKRLFIARDRLGIKPLYYYLDDKKLVFGSEIKAILKSPDIEKEVDPVALNQFLTFEYIPAPHSIFKKIRKLEPGHFLLYSDGDIQIKPYWQLRPSEDTWTEVDAKERLRELVQDSVKLRLISDVPLGAFLSGGIDSTIIVSQMAKLMDQPVKTFSIGFKESSYNELKYARAVANKYKTEHHEFTIEANALELTEKLIHHLDEPFGDFSIFPTYLVSKMARDFVTVTLSGDGGDELFAGYDTYRAHRFDRRFYHLLPKIVKHKMIEPWTESLIPTEKKKGVINSIKRFVEGTTLPKSIMHARWMVFLHEWERQQLFAEDMKSQLQSDPYDFLHKYAQDAEGLSDITKMGYMDVKSYLVDDILVKVDRMSMATSLEARVPFLDHRIVEFAYSLPSSLKMNGLKTKYLLVNSFWDEMPPEVQNRDKQGFSIPIKNWIREELKPMMMDLLNEQRLKEQGFLNPKFVHQLINEHLEGKANHSHKLWALMVFEQWFDIYGKS